MKLGSIIYNGVVRENPTFVLLLGMCPTLGTTGSAMTGLPWDTFGGCGT